MKVILPGRTQLGLYTDIILMESLRVDENGVVQPRRAIRYVYSHPVARPFGFALGDQCPRCFCLTQFDLKKAGRTWIILRCKDCKTKIGFQRPAGYWWVYDWHQPRYKAEKKIQKRAEKKGKSREDTTSSASWFLSRERMWLHASVPSPSTDSYNPVGRPDDFIVVEEEKLESRECSPAPGDLDD
jgi:hypothetical protein